MTHLPNDNNQHAIQINIFIFFPLGVVSVWEISLLNDITIAAWTSNRFKRRLMRASIPRNAGLEVEETCLLHHHLAERKKTRSECTKFSKGGREIFPDTFSMIELLHRGKFSNCKCTTCFSGDSFSFFFFFSPAKCVD